MSDTHMSLYEFLRMFVVIGIIFIGYFLNKMIFEIRGHESFSEMETALLDFCDEIYGGKPS